MAFRTETNEVPLFLHLSLQVQLLEAKQNDIKQKKIQFLEKARQHEDSIQSLRSSLMCPSTTEEASLNLSTVTTAAPPKRVLFPPSPTHPAVGDTPTSHTYLGYTPTEHAHLESNKKVKGRSFIPKYPLTSTPAASL